MCNLKEYMKNIGMNALELSRLSGLPRSTVSDIVNGRTDIDKSRTEVLIAVSRSLGLSVDETYEMAKMCLPTIDDDRFSLIVKEKSFYLHDKSSGENVYVAKNKKVMNRHIREVAQWKIEKIKRDEGMEKWKTKHTF